MLLQLSSTRLDAAVPPLAHACRRSFPLLAPAAVPPLLASAVVLFTSTGIATSSANEESSPGATSFLPRVAHCLPGVHEEAAHVGVRQHPHLRHPPAAGSARAGLEPIWEHL